MSGFSADWLALREPHDHRARVIATLPGPARSDPLRLVDLGCGSGSNLRYLAPRLGGHQHWRLLDNDPRLLAGLRPRLAEWAVTLAAHFEATAADRFTIVAPAFRLTVEARSVDLDAGVEALALQPGECVTASALLDLVSARWLDALIDACVAGAHPLLFALSYDGRITWAPHDPLDALVHTLFDRHQRGDKGFGAALGPTAVNHACERLAPHAATLVTEPSDWTLGPRDTAIQRTLIDDWTGVAIEVAPERRDEIQGWARRRHAHVEAGRSHLVVGHLDLAAGFSR